MPISADQEKATKIAINIEQGEGGGGVCVSLTIFLLITFKLKLFFKNLDNIL